MQSKLESRRAQLAAAELQERLLRGSAGGAAEADASSGEDAASGGEDVRSRRDVEMENELVTKLKGDPLADYDIEVTKEGEAIAEYLALLDSPVQLANGSSL